MEINLKAKEGELTITKYSVDYPFSVHTIYKNSNKILRTTQSIKCKKIKGDFRLYYSGKIDFTELTNKVWEEKITVGDSESSFTVKVKGGKVTSVPQNFALITDGENDVEVLVKNRSNFICFQKKIFLHVSLKNPKTYLHDRKERLPMWLIAKLEDIKKMVNFTLEYDNSALKVSDEEITIYLALEYE